MILLHSLLTETIKKMDRNGVLATQITSLALIMVISLPFVLTCNRYRYYGEPCVGYDKEVCDTTRMLKCDIRTGTCQCPDFFYYFFDNYNSRCYHKIGTACKETFGGLYESRYEHGCPPNSFCNPGSGYCSCKPLYKQNWDGTGCFNTSITQQSITFLIIGSSFMLMMLSN